MPRFVHRPEPGMEWLDDPVAAQISTETLSTSFREIRRLDRLVGATHTVTRHVTELLSSRGASLLDVGTGDGAVASALADWAESAGVDLEIVGVDLCPEVLAVARRSIGGRSIALLRADARALPFDVASFDVVTSLGLLHHFNEDEAALALSEMWRVARRGIVVADLARGPVLRVLAGAALNRLTASTVTRHDGLLSVRRAYTRREVEALAHRAGIGGVRLCRRRWTLQTLVAEKEDTST